ncbi:hypothetical protein BpHYR1_000944 [Brachionus plicatilis]|uniref:Uncharacterized protein n=1 Tax=Brachionus plicatilis TaxID=10195 RepID=A0A3M7RSS8_BRAPC|nr:hypothetical protein BpHYR1_000944 [Brachionus plicatilis]
MMPSMVSDVSAIFVAKITLRALSGVGSNILICMSDGKFDDHFTTCLDLFLASQKDKYVAEWLRYVNLKHRDYDSLQVVGLGLLGVEDIDGKAATRYAKNGSSVEKIRKFLAVHGGAGYEQFEIGAKPSNVLDQAE